MLLTIILAINVRVTPWMTILVNFLGFFLCFFYIFFVQVPQILRCYENSKTADNSQHKRNIYMVC